MRLFPGRQGRELNRMELALAALILGVLVWGMQDRLALRLDEAHARGEKALLDATRVSIQSGLNLLLADRLLRGDRRLLAAMHQANPFELRATVCVAAAEDCAAGGPRENGVVLTPPQGYLGAFAAAPPDWQPGQWYFNTLERTLEYRIRHAGFAGGTPEPVRARYQLRLLFDDLDGDGRPGPGEALQGARLHPLDPLRWTFEQ
jgi:hypothetical protein